MTPSVRPEEHDSDSAYSGDVSNTDSGRGPSEEGETQGQSLCTVSVSHIDVECVH